MFNKYFKKNKCVSFFALATLASVYQIKSLDLLGKNNPMANLFGEVIGNIMDDDCYMPKGTPLRETIDKIINDGGSGGLFDGITLKDDEEDHKNSDYNLRNMLPGFLFGYNKNAKTDKYKECPIGDGVVYYFEDKGNDDLPLVVWFHGNGDVCRQGEIKSDTKPNGLENTVISIQYPNYIEGRLGRFIDLESYTTLVAEFIKQYLESRPANRQVVLLSHSLGGNFNTLTFFKLRKVMDKDNLKSIMIYPYYSAINASSVLLKGKGLLTAIGENNLPDIGDAGDFADNAINTLLDIVYKKIYSDDVKDSKDFPTGKKELDIVEEITNNALILKKSGISPITDLCVIKTNKEHNEFSILNTAITNIRGKSIKEFCENFENFKVKDTTKDKEYNKSVIIFSSPNDKVVGQGGLLILQQLADLKRSSPSEIVHTPEIEKFFKDCFLYDLDDDSVEFLNSRKDDTYLKNNVNDIKKLANGETSMCSCLTVCMNKDEDGKYKNLVTDRNNEDNPESGDKDQKKTIL